MKLFVNYLNDDIVQMFGICSNSYALSINRRPDITAQGHEWNEIMEFSSYFSFYQIYITVIKTL